MTRQTTTTMSITTPTTTMSTDRVLYDVAYHNVASNDVEHLHRFTAQVPELVAHIVATPGLSLISVTIIE
jgi:hypothetical protein